MLRIDSNNIDIKKSEIIAFSCIRNELLRLPYFLKYHRDLGIDRFIFIDNASSDGSTNFLLSQNDVHVFYTEDSYAKSKCGVDWLNELLREYSFNHWALTLDADELFVYPLCETVDLHLLTRYLDMCGSQGVLTFMLDMYSDRAIKETYYTSGTSFLDVCRFFDVDTYVDMDKDNIPVRGGPRNRLFWQGYERDKPSPVLKKVPLVKWRNDLTYEASTHLISNVKLSSLTGVIQHFKLFSDFYKYAKSETERKEHWDGAAQYNSYWDVLRNNPDLCALFEGSMPYENSMQLVDLGMIRFPDSYASFIGE